MLPKVILADTIDGAVEEVLDELKQDARSSRRHNIVIYFDGWDGLGASAVLRAVGRRLTPKAGSRAPAAAGLEFTHIFHIDCSKWESRRTMQRIIAEQLKLPTSVMEMFDVQDEDDDYRGVGKGSRFEIPRVAEEINQQIQMLNLNGRSLFIFNNGSSNEIDLSGLGFPPFDRYSRSKVLWSFQGRFRVYPRMKVDGALMNTRTTDVLLSADSSGIGEDKLSDILHHEAEEVACEMNNAGGIDWRAAATNCFLHMIKLCRMSNDFTTDYDLATHVSNYCICDGIIHLQQGDIGTDDGVDKLWLSCGALQREMRLDADQLQNPYFPSPVEKSLLKRMAYWTSPTYGFVMIPDPDEQIPKGMFQQFDKLCVLKLSACKFSFTSPPFLCCHNLRFLWLDHCQEGDSTAEVMEEDARQFLQRLWVLDVRYSNGAFLSQEMMNFMTHLKELNVIGEEDTFDTDLLQGQQLCNIRKLRFTKSHVYEVTTRVSGMNKLELFEFSENTSVRWLYVESCNSLESVIIYGSTELLEIALTGCIKLKNLFLSGSFPELVAIAIAGAVVEILDLRAVTAPKLESLFLPDCEKLCAIRWPSPADGKRNIYLSKLMIDTKQKEGTAIDTNSPPSVSYYWNMFKKKINFDYHISVRDARILQSLKPVKDNFSSKAAHVEISTISSPTGSFTDVASTKDGRMRSSCGQRVQVKLKQPKDTAMYTDVVVTLKDTSTQQQQEAANEGDSSGAPGIMWTCPPPPEVLSEGCYIHIEDPSSRTKSQTASITLPGFICDCAKILHVHDCLHIASILAVPIASATWNKLQWCRVEQCPNLECVFSQLGGLEGNNNDTDMFKKLTTTWVSHLLKARYIWKWSSTSPIVPQVDTCENLTLLHIDCCPRLIQVTSWPPPMGTKELDRLEFLEILWCCDLSVAFHFYDTSNMLEWYLLKLIKHVHLHELPKLRNICNIGVTVMMPELKIIKIRGCWSLRRLPVVRKNVVECDCEKEWWDRLEWESVKHARHYKPIHPRHYKKTMLRGSILR